MNLRIRRVTGILLICYTLLFVQLNVVQIVRADTYRSDPANTRDIVREFTEARGTIRTGDGVVVALSVDVPGELERLRAFRSDRRAYVHHPTWGRALRPSHRARFIREAADGGDSDGEGEESAWSRCCACGPGRRRPGRVA